MFLTPDLSRARILFWPLTLGEQGLCYWPLTWGERGLWVFLPFAGSPCWPRDWHRGGSSTAARGGGGSRYHSAADSAGSGFLGAPAPSFDILSRDTVSVAAWQPVCNHSNTHWFTANPYIIKNMTLSQVLNSWYIFPLLKVQKILIYTLLCFTIISKLHVNSN